MNFNAKLRLPRLARPSEGMGIWGGWGDYEGLGLGGGLGCGGQRLTRGWRLNHSGLVLVQSQAPSAISTSPRKRFLPRLSWCHTERFRVRPCRSLFSSLY